MFVIVNGELMLKINVKSNFNQVLKEYEAIKDKRLPKQWGFALNDTGFWLSNQLNRKTADYFNKPVPAFTKKAFGFVRSTSKQRTVNTKRAYVGIKGANNVPYNSPSAKNGKGSFTADAAKRAVKIFDMQIYGGVRTPTSSYLLKPSAHTEASGGFTKFGGVDPNWVKRNIADEYSYFQGMPKNYPQNEHYRGLWQRTEDNLSIQMVAKYGKDATYEPRYPFQQLAETLWYPKLKKNLRRQLKFIGAKRRKGIKFDR